MCMRQIFQKVPLRTCFVQKELESMVLGASHQCVLFGCNVFLKIYFELLYWKRNQEFPTHVLYTRVLVCAAAIVDAFVMTIQCA